MTKTNWQVLSRTKNSSKPWVTDLSGITKSEALAYAAWLNIRFSRTLAKAEEK